MLADVLSVLAVTWRTRTETVSTSDWLAPRRGSAPLGTPISGGVHYLGLGCLHVHCLQK